jgi:hypothetical protein
MVFIPFLNHHKLLAARRRYFKPLDSSIPTKHLLIKISNQTVKIVSSPLQAGNPMSAKLTCSVRQLYLKFASTLNQR